MESRTEILEQLLAQYGMEGHGLIAAHLGEAIGAELEDLEAGILQLQSSGGGAPMPPQVAAKQAQMLQAAERLREEMRSLLDVIRSAMESQSAGDDTYLQLQQEWDQVLQGASLLEEEVTAKAADQMRNARNVVARSMGHIPLGS
jgi:hypothetical protein